MKRLIIGFVCGLLSVVLLGAASSNSVNWEQELQRPEAQRAISNYVMQRCNSTVSAAEVMKAIAANDGRQIVIQQYCWY